MFAMYNSSRRDMSRSVRYTGVFSARSVLMPQRVGVFPGLALKATWAVLQWLRGMVLQSINQFNLIKLTKLNFFRLAQNLLKEWGGSNAFWNVFTVY
jgi:hypothetical protein